MATDRPTPELADTAARLAAARSAPSAPAEPAPQPQSRANPTSAASTAPAGRAGMAPQPTSRARGAPLDGTADIVGSVTNASVPAPDQPTVNTAGTLQEAMDRGEPLVIRPRPAPSQDAAPDAGS